MVDDAGIQIDHLCGICPVQAEGTIDGHRFYFRARWNQWTVEINTNAATTTDYLNWPAGDIVWEHAEEWGDSEYAAGWMPEDTARTMIARAADLWRTHLKTLSTE